MHALAAMFYHRFAAFFFTMHLYFFLLSKVKSERAKIKEFTQSTVEKDDKTTQSTHTSDTTDCSDTVMSSYVNVCFIYFSFSFNFIFKVSILHRSVPSISMRFVSLLLNNSLFERKRRATKKNLR